MRIINRGVKFNDSSGTAEHQRYLSIYNIAQ